MEGTQYKNKKVICGETVALIWREVSEAAGWVEWNEILF